jgi:hypothetical protein
MFINAPSKTTKKFISAAILVALGIPVQVEKQSCTPRCLCRYPDTPESRRIIERFEAGEVLEVSQLAIWNAYRQLTDEARRLQAGRIGGVI